jgi:branched-chain amino acid transport system permease protein
MMSTPARLLLLAAVLVLALFPLTGDVFHMQLLTKVMILAILAMSLDLLVGYTGLVSLGHAAFYGLAGYTLALIQPQYEPMSFLVSLPIALGICALFALASGALVLRTRGIYFIMVTLAFAQMVYFVFHDTKLGGGSDGIYVNSKPIVGWGDFKLIDLDNRTTLYYTVLALMLGVYLLLARILNSNFGRALQGIKVNEHRMRAIGFPVFRYQLGVYVLAGVLAGLSGYLAALQFGFVNPEIVSWHQSGAVLMMVILGGMGTLGGAVVGAFAFVLLEEFFKDDTVFGAFAKHWQLMMGALIVAVACFLPNGLFGLLQRRKPAAGAAAADTAPAEPAEPAEADGPRAPRPGVRDA